MEQTYFPDSYTLDDIFSKTIIECLPGTFYIYQVLPDGVKIKRWNKFHRDLFGLTDKECLNRTPFSFVVPSHHQKLLEAIGDILERGFVKHVLVDIIDKDGEQIPYIFEGYKFQIGDDTYFTGTGIDVSDLVSAKEHIQILALEKKQIVEDINRQEKKLLALALQENKNSFLLNTITLKLQHILKSKDLDYIDRETRKLLSTLSYEEKAKDNWEKFEESFVNVHKNFFEKLKENHPDLSAKEVMFCSYLKINMSSIDLCTALNISKDGLKKKRYRLKKKLQLDSDVSVKEYISSF